MVVATWRKPQAESQVGQFLPVRRPGNHLALPDDIECDLVPCDEYDPYNLGYLVSGVRVVVGKREK